MLLLGLLAVAVAAAVIFPSFFASNPSIRYDEFEQLLDSGKLKKVVLVGNDRLNGEVRDDVRNSSDEMLKAMKIAGGKFSVKLLPATDRDPLYQRLRTHGVEFDTQDEHGAWFGGSQFTTTLIATLVLVGLFAILLMRFRDPLGGGLPGSFGRSPARKYDRGTKNKVTFDDVAAMESAKVELQEVAEFLKTPEKFHKLGAQIPKGILLVGPPGIGKTLLARAVAGEANATFLSINGAEFIQMFVGVGASRVRDLFRTAKESSPCLIFIDEIDAVGRMRGAGVGGGSDEREQTLNQILGEMDGFQPTDAVIVLAATNRPDVLDAALLRPGRFDRHVTIERPTWQGRLAILKVHTRNKPLADSVDLEELARACIGMTGADLRNLANEAALLAARSNRTRIEKDDFAQASDRVLLGLKREEILTPEGKKKTAYHEAGHALVSWLEPDADPPHRVTIVPRGRALGVTIPAPDEERFHHGLDYWKARLAVLMGGRAADRLIFNQPFSGHENDLKQATQMARYMVTHWGMSDRLGPMAFRIGEEHVFLGKEIQEPRDFSEGTARLIDEEVQKLLREADERAFQLLNENRDKLEAIVAALLVHEELDYRALESIIRPGALVQANGTGEPTASRTEQAATGV
ncbi:MAG: ATP-dependent zinc metalloprotease FtsH [Gemmataceae bacterium]